MSVCIIGVDAGGTSTRAAMYDQSGQTLYEAKSGYGNMLVNAQAAMGHMGDAIASCISSFSGTIPPGCLHIYIGPAGIHAGDNKAALADYLRHRFPEAIVHIEDDALLALYAITQGNDGILVIAGTGSIAYGKQGERVQRAGGWGNILGDEGSGYDIVRKALSLITAEFDAGTAYSRLSNRILAQLQTDVWGVVQFCHTKTKGDIAALLPLIESVALEGDPTAVGLLEAAAEALANLAGKLYTRMGFADNVSVAVKGGVLEKTPLVLASFIRNLNPACFTVCPERASSEKGAFYLFLAEQGLTTNFHNKP